MSKPIIHVFFLITVLLSACTAKGTSLSNRQAREERKENPLNFALSLAPPARAGVALLAVSQVLPTLRKP